MCNSIWIGGQIWGFLAVSRAMAQVAQSWIEKKFGRSRGGEGVVCAHKGPLPQHRLEKRFSHRRARLLRRHVSRAESAFGHETHSVHNACMRSVALLQEIKRTPKFFFAPHGAKSHEIKLHSAPEGGLKRRSCGCSTWRRADPLRQQGS